MARLPRVIAVDTPHHVTQRGNAGRFVFQGDADRLVYLQLLHQNCRLHGLSLLGYCLMSNHVHLVAVPERADSLELALQHAHGRYAAYFNARYESSGHLWQGRYYSCPLDRAHLWRALRYTELNPVRAGLVMDPAAYRWSSAANHCGRGAAYTPVDLAPWPEPWSASDWSEYLNAAISEDEAMAIRKCTHTGRPLGGETFVHGLEKALSRRLMPGKGGRPRKEHADARQRMLLLE